jgi:hypothetical protein
VSLAGGEQVFLTKVAKLGAEVLGDGEVIVDHEANAGAAGDREDCISEAADFFGGTCLSPKLNEVCAAVT